MFFMTFASYTCNKAKLIMDANAYENQTLITKKYVHLLQHIIQLYDYESLK